MPATTGYNAGTDANQVLLSYGVEAVWGTAPASQFQAIRAMSESLSGSKTRNRPTELNTTGEVSAAVTVQEQAGGQVNFALSYGTYDNLLESALGADWQAALAIAGIAGDITITSGTKILSSTLTTKFSAIPAGAWIKLMGFTNAGNNGYWRVATKTDNSHLVLAGPGTIVTETPATTLAQVRASNIVNGSLFKSLSFQKKLAAALFLRYPGCYVSGFTLSGGVGQFLQGNFTLLAQSEASAITDQSTGAVLAAPAGRVHDPIGGFVGVYWNEAPVGAAVDSFSVQVQSQGAGLQYGMGSAAAQGVNAGLDQVSGTLKMYFKDFSLYAVFKAETFGALSIITKDAAGAAYAICIPQCALMNPKIVAGGQNQPVMAEFEIEGNPQAAGGTITIDRLAAS